MKPDDRTTKPPARGTLSLSWGPSGGFYVCRHRLCLGRVALTYVPGVEIDALMAAYADCIAGAA